MIFQIYEAFFKIVVFTSQALHNIIANKRIKIFILEYAWAEIIINANDISDGDYNHLYFSEYARALTKDKKFKEAFSVISLCAQVITLMILMMTR